MIHDLQHLAERPLVNSVLGSQTGCLAGSLIPYLLHRKSLELAPSGGAGMSAFPPLLGDERTPLVLHRGNGRR